MNTATLEKPIHINDADFDEIVGTNNQPVLVDFWADWCGPCHTIAPLLEELAAEYGERLRVAKLNVDENPEKPAAFGIRSIPTLLLFRNGQPVQTLVGVQPKSTLKAAIDAQLG